MVSQKKKKKKKISTTVFNIDKYRKFIERQIN